MKNPIKIFVILVVLVGCNNQTKNITEKLKSHFNLKQDYAEFKTKMTDLDTLKIWVNHSVCTYQGYEKLEITKKNKEIKIKAEYNESTFENKQRWKIVYVKTISENDTIWDFGKFLKHNKKRLKSKTEKYGILQIRHKNDKIQFFTNGLSDLNRFMSEYFKTMIKIYPENKENIYGYEAIQLLKGKN